MFRTMFTKIVEAFVIGFNLCNKIKSDSKIDALKLRINIWK